MNLDELRSVQNRERQTDSLQHLRDSFYEEVGRYIADLKAERERVADRSDDPWSDPEIQQLSDEIDTAEEVAESIYERRMGKLVKDASLAAAGYATDTEGLTLEEERLFEDLVARIETNKASVLEVLSGDTIGDDGSPVEAHESGADATPEPSDGQADETTAPPDPNAGPSADASPITDSGDDGVDAASMMEPDPAPEPDGAANGDRRQGGTLDAETPGPGSDAPDTGGTAEAAVTDELSGDPLVDDTAAESEASDEPATPPAPNASGETNHQPSADPKTTGQASSSRRTEDARSNDPDHEESIERTTVRITSDIGEILGIDDHEYHLTADDVVTLPEENAEPLVERDAAEPLE